MSDIHGLKVDFRDDTHHAREFLEGMKGEHARDILEKGDKFKDFNKELDLIVLNAFVHKDNLRIYKQGQKRFFSGHCLESWSEKTRNIFLCFYLILDNF